jgi:hypothetical protein
MLKRKQMSKNAGRARPSLAPPSMTSAAQYLMLNASNLRHIDGIER